MGKWGDEVHSLAGSSRDSTYQIGQFTSTTVEKINELVALIKELKTKPAGANAIREEQEHAVIPYR